MQPFGFTGYQMDVAGGLYFAQARRYDASTGRFVSEDKVKGFADAPFTLNPYSYCWNKPMVLVDLNGMWPEWAENAWSSVKTTVSGVVDTVQNFYEEHKEGIQTALKITGAVAVTGLLIAGTVATGGALGVVCAGALTGEVVGMGTNAVVQLSTKGAENFSLDELLISGGSGALSGALSVVTANPGALFTGNALINAGSYALTQETNNEEIMTNELVISAIVGGFSGVAGGSSKETATIAQEAIEHAALSQLPYSLGKQEVIDFIISTAIGGGRRSLIVESGRIVIDYGIKWLYDKLVELYKNLSGTDNGCDECID